VNGDRKTEIKMVIKSSNSIVQQTKFHSIQTQEKEFVLNTVNCLAHGKISAD
jgi:hypothetical protein